MIWIGLELAPAYGQWLSVTADLTAEMFHAFGRSLCRTYMLRSGTLTPPDEYAIQDTAGFGPLAPSTIEEALMFSELKDELNQEGPEKWAALPSWLNHRGSAYTLYESGRLRDAWSIAEAFDQDYLGTYPSEEAYAEERFTEAWMSGVEESAVPGELLAQVFAYMNWDALSNDYDGNDVYFGGRNTHGIPVFRRN